MSRYFASTTSATSSLSTAIHLLFFHASGMSINTANTPDGRGVLIYNGEVILVFAQSVVMTIGKTPNEVCIHCSIVCHVIGGIFFF